VLLRGLIFVHRWVGIAICVVFLIWFPSGIGMMYWSMPSVTAADRLERAPALDAARIALSPAEAAAKLGVDATPAQIRLNTFDGRPVYRIGAAGRGGGGGRGGGARIVYADTGEIQERVSTPMQHRIASAWTGQPADDASVELMTDVDQWTVGGLRNVRPLYKYSWPNGEQLYLAGGTGEVVQYTTTASRIAAHVSAIPHWIYYTPIRKHQPFWLQFMIWTAGIGTIGSILGVVVGVWMYSPNKRYRNKGAPTAIPYRGQKRWHTIIGLCFGVAAVTYAFSGMMSLDPFPELYDRRPPAAQGGARPGVAQALRGRVGIEDFAAAHPRDIVARHPQLRIKELELTSFAGEPMYGAALADGTTRMIRLDGTPIDTFDHSKIVDIVQQAAPNRAAVTTTVLDQYDLYYLDRRRERPLPVILAKMNDEEKTRYYIDPKTARIVGQYSNRNWVNRWLYTGLHSLNFPWLYNYRPLWDIVVITLMVGGTALCVTSLVLAWRVLGRKLARAASRRAPTDVLTVDT
jgi:hypothetical protein